MGVQVPCVYASLENSAQAKSFAGCIPRKSENPQHCWHCIACTFLHCTLSFSGFHYRLFAHILCNAKIRGCGRRKFCMRACILLDNFFLAVLAFSLFFFLDISSHSKLQQNYLINLSIFTCSNFLSFSIIEIIIYGELMLEYAKKYLLN